jgi:hypothetical protein
MKHKLYKYIFTFIAISFLGTAFAQKFDKKFTENFTTNKDVEVAINASNTDINVTTWDKNEVQIEAFIEIEGISKEEAEKYFKNWEFEALGNKRKVQITSKGNNAFNFKNDFVFFDDMNFDFEMPNIDFSSFENIELPKMDFDFDFNFDFKDVFEDIDENMGKDGKYNFRWHDDDHDIVINTKKEWEEFKKSKKYAELKNKMHIDKEKLRKDFAESKEEMKRQLKESQEKYKKVDIEQVKKELLKAKEELKKLKFEFFPLKNSKETIINGKKIKIKKRLEIKVPKGATFDLNTRHCKVTLPNTVAFGNVKYGTFNAHNLNGGELTIDYSPVTINDLNACTLFLNNVRDAKITSLTNTNLNSNSSKVFIKRINNKVDIKSKFGDIELISFNPNFDSFHLNLEASSAILYFTNLKDKLNFSATFLTNNPNSNNIKNTTFHGIISAKNNRISIDGKNSKLTVIK